MTLLYYDPLFLEHHTGANHPEQPQRLVQIVAHLAATGLDARCTAAQWQPASADALALIHQPAYVARIEAITEKGGGRLDADTTCSPRSYDAALLAAGAVADAVGRVVRGDDRQALCLVRPPGHHALAGTAMGFCLFGNIALGARMATSKLGLDRVLVVDFDVHHGNGTQAIFWDDPQVGFLSIHRWPFYPGTGDTDETGGTRALGTKVNIPVKFGTPRAEYLAHFQSELERLAAKIRPQLVLVSAGFDAHREDPIGSLELETEDFAQLTRAVLDVAKVHADGKVVSVLEGGYNTQALADSVGVHLATMLDDRG
jgi:acetoin utilization deacetylase AcuC-like enzyme